MTDRIEWEKISKLIAAEQEANRKDPVNNLEYDLFNTEWILNKVQDKIYAQNLYAAMCNNRFFKNNQEWTTSWRSAGGIIADLRNCGENYMDWYCSGITHNDDKAVGEGVVTKEISEDLLKLGWTVKPYEPTLEPGVYTNVW